MGDTVAVDEKGIVIRARWLVTADATDNPLIAYGASADGNTVPVYYDLYDAGYPLLRAANIGISRWQDEKSPVFLVEIEYRVVTVEKKPDGGGKWNKKVSSSGLEIVERVTMDVTKHPVKNSFGDITTDFEHVNYDAVIAVSFNTDSSASFTAMENARGRINESAVTLNITRFGVTYNRTYPAKTLKLGNATWDIDIGPDGEGSFAVYIPLIYRHQLQDGANEIGWQVQTPDRGYRYLTKISDGVFQPVKVEEIVDLDGTGQKLAAGAVQKMILADMTETADFDAFLSGL